MGAGAARRPARSQIPTRSVDPLLGALACPRPRNARSPSGALAPGASLGDRGDRRHSRAGTAGAAVGRAVRRVVGRVLGDARVASGYGRGPARGAPRAARRRGRGHLDANRNRPVRRRTDDSAPLGAARRRGRRLGCRRRSPCAAIRADPARSRARQLRRCRVLRCRCGWRREERLAVPLGRPGDGVSLSRGRRFRGLSLVCRWVASDPCRRPHPLGGSAKRRRPAARRSRGAKAGRMAVENDVTRRRRGSGPCGSRCVASSSPLHRAQARRQAATCSAFSSSRERPSETMRLTRRSAIRL